MKDKLKVLLVSPYSPKRTGGIGTWTKIVLDFNEKEQDLDLLFLNTSTSLPKRKSMGNRVVHLLIGAIDSLRILLKLFWRMLIFHPDIVHYTSSAGSALRKDLIAIWIVKKVFGKKFVIHWHFGRIPMLFSERNDEYHNLVKVCNKADISIPIDERSYNAMIGEGLKAVNIPNPIPVALQNEASKLAVESLNTDRVSGEVLFVGHVLKNKGVFELVQACAKCDEVNRLVVVGPFFDESMREKLISLAKQRDNGNWLELSGEKSREEVWNYYRKCSVFCLPSYSEGFPYVILEAMAFGCPIVATKVGAIPEMLNGGCGEIVESKLTEELNIALAKVLNEGQVAKEMGERAHLKVLSEYTIERVFAMYKNVWESLIEN